MSKLYSAVRGLLNLRARHASRSVNQKQSVVAPRSYFSFGTRTISQRQLPRFVKGKQLPHWYLAYSPSHRRETVWFSSAQKSRNPLLSLVLEHGCKTPIFTH
jgi:hypothetical protein